MRTTPLFICALGVAATAQTTKYVPPTHETVEGNSTNTYPFGRAVGGLQVLVDAPFLTTQSGFVSAVSFRPNGLLLGATTAIGYSAQYKLTCWNTNLNAAAMTNVPANNAGTGTPTVVFNANLTLPSVGPSALMPEPFSVRFPFGSVYQFSGSTSNFLMQVETVGTIAPPSTWAIDALSTNKSNITGLQVRVAAQCTYLNNRLNTTLGATEAAKAIPGGMVTYSVASTAVGAWPMVLAILGTTNAAPGYPLDLSVLGMPGCTLNVNAPVTQTLAETAGAYPTVVWPIPAFPTLVGATVYVQNLGVNSLTSLVGAVTSDAFAVTIGDATAPAGVKAQSIFSTNLSTWSIGTAGAYHPVLKFEGVFP